MRTRPFTRDEWIARLIVLAVVLVLAGLAWAYKEGWVL